MSNFVSRLFEEHSQLWKKLEKLKEFILSDAFNKLPEVEQRDLKEQLKHMDAYQAVLNRRVSRQCNNA